MARTPDRRGGLPTHGLDDHGRSYAPGRRVTRWPVGTVYTGEVKPSGASCCLIFPDVLPNEIESFVRGFADEVARNRLLVGLPIIGVMHVGVNLDGRAFLVLPPVAEIESVEQRVRTHGPLAPLVALQIAVMLADALARLHYRVRAVGEIRPWQVLLPGNRRETLRMFDLGVPRGLFRHTITPPRVDAHYTSPAVRAGSPPTAVDDVYSVGAVLHFMLSGEPPPLTANPFPPNRGHLGPFASFIDGLLMQAITPDPDRGADAFEDMHAFARALRGLRDLHRLSPSARHALIGAQGLGGERVPGAERMPTGALGFIESDGPSFLTQADLESIEDYRDR